ncbi:putative protein TPRXL [Xiphias gladius]|uniref:putative protein TPRXL n=1 Tax=Xiphias gladius TaxID=8245 RepID=UPI001A99369E|nr:putative protein TPRXL [Xiphias gladius]XP_039996807.1 putative protein TPRXL [Xiphias gladius]XP_039996808.1 putative protein TPRXL [Xiphias gladius]
MKSSSSSSSVTSASATAGLDAQLLSSLQSPGLQAEFLEEGRSKSQSGSDFGESGVPSPATPPSSPRSSSSSSSSPRYGGRQARLSLSSPELLSELRESRTRPLRHVPAHNGLTLIFSGQGGQASAPALSTRPANQMTSH